MCLFRSLLCQRLAPRVLRVVLGNLPLSQEYSVEFEKTDGVQYCYVIYWEDDHLKKICIDSQSLDQKFPEAELVPIARVICSVEERQLPIALRGSSPLLLRVLSENLCHSRQFIVIQAFNDEVFMQCFRQAHQFVFGKVELITFVEYIVRRMRSDLHEEWTEDRVVFRQCLLKGVASFEDLRSLVVDLIDLWPSMKPYICRNRLPHAKDAADLVSRFDFSTSVLMGLLLLLMYRMKFSDV